MKISKLPTKISKELEPVDSESMEEDVVLAKVLRARKEFQDRPQNSKRKPGDDKLNAIVGNYIRPNAVETGVLLEMTVRHDEAMFVKPLRNRLIADNNATSLAEKMAIDLAIVAYFRSLRFSFSHVMSLEQITNLNSLKAMTELGKQVDAANHRFFAAISFLKELRRPPINVKVLTKETYIAQNQQVNNDKAT